LAVAVFSFVIICQMIAWEGWVKRHRSRDWLGR